MNKISHNSRFCHRNFSTNKSEGFIQIVLLAVVVIAALGYFNIDLRTVFENPIVQKIWNIFVVAYVSYVKPLVVYLWASFNGLHN